MDLLPRYYHTVRLWLHYIPIYEMYFAFPSGKQPVDNICKKKGPSKKYLQVKTIDLSHSEPANQISSRPVELAGTSAILLSGTFSLCHNYNLLLFKGRWLGSIIFQSSENESRGRFSRWIRKISNIRSKQSHSCCAKSIQSAGNAKNNRSKVTWKFFFFSVTQISRQVFIYNIFSAAFLSFLILPKVIIHFFSVYFLGCFSRKKIKWSNFIPIAVIMLISVIWCCIKASSFKELLRPPSDKRS